jgi:hypothetical protein
VFRYKSYKDALVLGSKGNSTAGCTSQQIASHQTSLLVMQLKRCPSFNVFDQCFSETPNVKPVYPQEIGGNPDEVAIEDSQVEAGEAGEGSDLDEHEPATPPAAPVASSSQQVPSRAALEHQPATPPAGHPANQPAAPVASSSQQVPSRAALKAAAPQPVQLVPSRAAPQAAGGGGKPAATFHLAPSKKEKKMDLGEAYLKAQQARIESVAVSAQAKIRCDLVIALTVQGKTAQEIAAFLVTTGF